MPISKSAVPFEGAELSRKGRYLDSLASFVKDACVNDRRPPVVSLFHAVRTLDYFSSADRSPEAVLRDRRGACTAKHILLRDALRQIGEAADVELVEGDFAASMPIADSMPDELRTWIWSGGIKDYHCYVVWRGPERELILDATWPDKLLPLGFPVNHDWVGTGDTALAIEPTFVKSRVEDVIIRKERLLQSLTREEAYQRQVFLKLFSEWLATVPAS